MLLKTFILKWNYIVVLKNRLILTTDLQVKQGLTGEFIDMSPCH